MKPHEHLSEKHNVECTVEKQREVVVVSLPHYHARDVGNRDTWGACLITLCLCDGKKNERVSQELGF